MQSDRVDQLANLDLLQNVHSELQLGEYDKNALQDLLLQQAWCLLNLVAIVDQELEPVVDSLETATSNEAL